jgi:ribonuclease P protein component
LRRGIRAERPAFQLIALANGEQASRLGLTVGRRLGPASVRNRAKRLLREVFRRNKGLLPRPLDVVLVARPALRELSYAEVEREYRAALEESERRHQGAARRG